jgi:hypothetical protein
MMSRIWSAAVALLLLAPAARAKPICDGRYHWIDVPGTKCLDGTQTGLEYICNGGSAAAPLVVFLEGGGACGDGVSCDCQADGDGNCTGTWTMQVNHFARAQSYDGQLFGQEKSPSMTPTPFGQSPIFNGPSAPFNGWNILYIPYCTGDAHTGDLERDYVTPDGRKIHAWHYGFLNVALDLLRARTLFPAPQRIVVSGDSAGAMGSDCNLSRLHDTWSGVPMTQLSVGGFPFTAS